MRTSSLITIALGVAGLLFAWKGAEAATLSQRFEKTYPLRSGGDFQLRNVNGGVTIEAWDRDEVRVQAEKKVRAGSDEDAKKVMDQVHIDVSQTGGGLKVETRLPKRGENGFLGWLTGNDVNIDVEYHVWVPRDAAVDAGSTNGGVRLTGTRGRARLESTNGGLTAQKVTGDLTLETTNGSIRVEDSAGAVQASTTNGGIDVSLDDVPNGSDLSFETTNGGVKVQLPRDIRVSLDAATSNGSVASDFEVAGAGKSRRHVAGDINGGGGKLRVRTTNGGIRIVEG
jgi:DUF4097 and DUF4098 domain-containing protein YvlB